MAVIANAQNDLKLTKGVAHLAVKPGCLTVDMNNRILTALTAICFVLLVFASPHSAQEQQVGDQASSGNWPQENRRVVSIAEAEKMRGELVTALSESEALIRFLAEYSFIRQSKAMKGYEEACQSMSKQRLKIEQMPTAEVLAQANNWPDSHSMNRVIRVSKGVRTDVKFQQVLQKAERYAEAGLITGKPPVVREVNLRGVIAAPSYIAPTCDFDDPSNYPSGTDISIANAVALALHTAADAVPDQFFVFGFGIPNPIHIALVIAAGVADQVLNALQAIAADGVYCEAVRLFIEVKLINDAGITAILTTDDFYLKFMLRTVRASLSKATGASVPTNCGSTRLTEAQAFFDGSDNFTGTGAQRVDAYKKLRAAYQNIGASACVQ